VSSKEEQLEKMKEEARLIIEMRKDPFLFIKIMWNIVPQNRDEKYIKGKHISRQQVQMLQAMKDAVGGKASRKISIKS
jgi:hypothetical protein